MSVSSMVRLDGLIARKSGFESQSAHSTFRLWNACLAQLVERMTFNHVVVGSSPTAGNLLKD